ncbi:hypothetical protein GOBAR_DD00503 [Gossypium barbadense]|nr:hypothetical protein GOBAR_DD00503 [Gossypium barbadense]
MVQPGEISDSVSADSSCPATSDASSSTKINQTFNNKKLNVRLDEKSFLQWKQQVFLTVRNHGLEKFLNGEVIVPSAKVRNSEGELVENEAHERYIQQDCALASWFLLLRVADLVVDHTHNTNFVAMWDILLTNASIGLIIPFRVSPRAVIDHHGQCLQLIFLRPLVQSSTARDIQLDPSVSATWFVDSEATHHVTNESQAFSAG